MKRNSLWNTKKQLPAVFFFLVIGLTGCDDKATPTATEYTVTFDAGTGGTLTDPATVQVETGETIAKPKDPTREGFSFVEWRKSDGTAFIFNSETVTANITLTAQWTQNFTVTFAGEDVTISPQTVADGSMANEPPTPTRDGFTFVEWQKTDGTAFAFDTETITANIMLTAQWAKVHTVTFDPAKGGTLTSSATVQVADGETLTEPTPPTKVGSTFAGWQKADGSAFAFTTETITADIILTAQWTLEYNPLTQLTDASSALRWWMQRATDNAQLPATNRYFTRGTDANQDVVSIYIDGAAFSIFVSGRGAPSTQTGIPTTERGGEGNFIRPLGFADLFGTGKTADGYAVNEDTLYIIQNQANAQTRTTLATMVINSTAKGLFVQAGEASGLLLPSDSNTDPQLNYTEWLAQAQLADGDYEGISSTSSDVGVGSKLTFHMNSARDDIDSVSFAQSPTGANTISDINDGTIALIGNSSATSNTPAQWPKAETSTNFAINILILRQVADNKIAMIHYPSNGAKTDLVRIAIVTPGGNLAVTYLPARNPGTAEGETAATEVTVTYRRPSGN